MRRSISILTMSWLLMLGSFAFAQDDITDDQVFAQMKNYIIHLNRKGVTAKKFDKQLQFLQKIKELWKEDKFQHLHKMSLEKLFNTQTNHPYFLLALAFYDFEGTNDDFAQTIKSMIDQKTFSDLKLVEKAVQFRTEFQDIGSFTRRKSIPQPYGSYLNITRGDNGLLYLVEQIPPGEINIFLIGASIFTVNTLKPDQYTIENTIESRSCNSPYFDFDNPPTVAAMRPDRNWMAACATDQLDIWNSHDDSEFNFRTDSPCTSLAFSPDGNTLAVGHLNGNITFYDFRNLSHPSSVMKPGYEELALPIQALAFNMHGNRLWGSHLYGTFSSPPDDKSYFVFEDWLYTPDIRTFAFHPLDEHIAAEFHRTNRDGGDITLFDPISHTFIDQVTTDTDIKSMVFSADGELLITVGYQTQIDIYSKDHLPDWSIINLIDPDTIRPTTGGGGGGK